MWTSIRSETQPALTALLFFILPPLAASTAALDLQGIAIRLRLSAISVGKMRLFLPTFVLWWKFKQIVAWNFSEIFAAVICYRMKLDINA